MNRHIADATGDKDTLTVVRNDSGRYGFWLERRNTDNTIDMSHVAWLDAETTETLADQLKEATS